MKYYLLVLDEGINEYYLQGVFPSKESIPNDLLMYCTYKIVEGSEIQSGMCDE